MVEVNQDKITNKRNPTFVLKRDNRLSFMKPKHLNQKFDTHFARFYESEYEMPIVESIKNLNNL